MQQRWLRPARTGGRTTMTNSRPSGNTSSMCTMFSCDTLDDSATCGQAAQAARCTAGQRDVYRSNVPPRTTHLAAHHVDGHLAALHHLQVRALDCSAVQRCNASIDACVRACGRLQPHLERHLAVRLLVGGCVHHGRRAPCMHSAAQRASAPPPLPRAVATPATALTVENFVNPIAPAVQQRARRPKARVTNLAAAALLHRC